METRTQIPGDDAARQIQYMQQYNRHLQITASENSQDDT
jgi:hypothetical protein